MMDGRMEISKKLDRICEYLWAQMEGLPDGAEWQALQDAETLMSLAGSDLDDEFTWCDACGDRDCPGHYESNEAYMRDHGMAMRGE